MLYDTKKGAEAMKKYYERETRRWGRHETYSVATVQLEDD